MNLFLALRGNPSLAGELPSGVIVLDATCTHCIVCTTDIIIIEPCGIFIEPRFSTTLYNTLGYV